MTVRSGKILRGKDRPPFLYEVAESGAGFLIRRNSAVLLSPAGGPFQMPTRALAEGVAEEWRRHKDKIVPATMPLTQLVATTLDIIRPHRAKTVSDVSRYAEADLLCFRAEQPHELVQRQADTWQPVIDWCAEKLGSRLLVGSGIMPLRQSSKTLAAFASQIERFDDFWLTGLKQAAEVSGSLCLGLALADGFLSSEAVYKAAELETLFQAETWGEDADAASRQKSVADDLDICSRWFQLLKT